MPKKKKKAGTGTAMKVLVRTRPFAGTHSTESGAKTRLGVYITPSSDGVRIDLTPRLTRYSALLRSHPHCLTPALLAPRSNPGFLSNLNAQGKHAAGEGDELGFR